MRLREVLFCLLAVVSWTGPAWGYCRTTTCAEKRPPAECVRDSNGCWAAGTPLQWRQQCVSFSVSERGSPRLGLDYATAEEIVQAAFNLWANASCEDSFPSIALSSRSPLMCERREYNPSGPNANAVLFRDNDWRHDSIIIALTTVSFDPRTGELLNADMEINSQDYDTLSPLELQYVIAHEAGHFLGLDHSADHKSLMFYRDSFDGMSEPMLTPDDVAALCAAYPPSREVPACNFEPAKGFATDCGGNVTAACAVAPGSPTHPLLTAASLLLILILAAHLQRGRRR